MPIMVPSVMKNVSPLGDKKAGGAFSNVGPPIHRLMCFLLWGGGGCSPLHNIEDNWPEPHCPFEITPLVQYVLSLNFGRRQAERCGGRDT